VGSAITTSVAAGCETAGSSVAGSVATSSTAASVSGGATGISLDSVAVGSATTSVGDTAPTSGCAVGNALAQAAKNKVASASKSVMRRCFIACLLWVVDMYRSITPERDYESVNISR
jgi:CCR4-NOT transcriptional regulation complex NOT5 subunit